MKPGFWNIKSKDGKVNFNANVIAGENTIFFQADGGEYTVTPRKSPAAKVLSTDENLMPGNK
jgi:hypothetical protein